MKTYRGWRMADGAHVAVVLPDSTITPLRPRLDLFNHSPTGFEWGYGGSGPAQLALALLADVLRNDALAMHLHQVVKRKVVARLDRDQRWEMTEDDVVRHAAAASSVPLMRMPDGAIRRCCRDCTVHLLERGMVLRDQLGVYEMAPGVTLEDTRKAVAGRHREDEP
jgi:hypothetical protein